MNLDVLINVLICKRSLQGPCKILATLKFLVSSYLYWLGFEKQGITMFLFLKIPQRMKNEFKDYLHYKTITSQNVPSEAQDKIFFLFYGKVVCRSQDIFLYFKRSLDLPNL